MSHPYPSKYRLVNTIFDKETVDNMGERPEKYNEGTYVRAHNAQYDHPNNAEYYHIITVNGKKVFRYGKHPEYLEPERMPHLEAASQQDSNNDFFGGRRSQKRSQKRRRTHKKTTRKHRRDVYPKKKGAK